MCFLSKICFCFSFAVSLALPRNAILFTMVDILQKMMVIVWLLINELLRNLFISCISLFAVIFWQSVVSITAGMIVAFHDTHEKGESSQINKIFESSSRGKKTMHVFG
uniref:Uncharacterized protein n=1 Tax=Ditylum brightwellii TaxID=49249 RepID=A0A7S1Z7I2_9STRA